MLTRQIPLMLLAATVLTGGPLTHASAQNIPGFGSFNLNSVLHGATAYHAPPAALVTRSAAEPPPNDPYASGTQCPPLSEQNPNNPCHPVANRAAERNARERVHNQITLLYLESRRLLAKPAAETTPADMARLRALPAEWARLEPQAPTGPRGARVWWEQKLPPKIAQKQAEVDASHH